MAQEIFPMEIVSHFLSYLQSENKCLYSCLFVSKAWYAASIVHLYSYPVLHGRAMKHFFKTICPQSNAPQLSLERASWLAKQIRHLDLKSLGFDIFDFNKDSMSLLLNQVKNNLISLVAPKMGYVTHILDSIRNCARLKHLSLEHFTDSINYEILCQLITCLPELRSFVFPKITPVIFNVYGTLLTYNRGENVTWPTNLEEIVLSPYTDEIMIHQLDMYFQSHVPKKLEKLNIHLTILVLEQPIISIFKIIGLQLRHLELSCHTSEIFPGAFDCILKLCPSLTYLLIREDIVSEDLLEKQPTNHKLQCLELIIFYSLPRINAEIILHEIENGFLRNLRSVTWKAGILNKVNRVPMPGLNALTETLIDMENENPLHVPCGARYIRN